MIPATAALVTRWTLARQSLSPALFIQRKLLCVAYKICSPPDINFITSRTFSSSPVNTTPSQSSSPPSPATRNQTDSAPVLALIFDTETTGKVNFDRTATDAIQPDLVQLGFLLVDTTSWVPRTQASLLVRLRDGVRIEPGAQAVHGVSASDCLRFGVAADTAAGLFSDACRRADVLVAHNVRFDAVVMEAALDRASAAGLSAGVVSGKRRVCTMRETTGLCRLPAGFGGGYKWPSLSEAYAFVTEGGELRGGHDAMVDAEACLKVFRFLVEGGHVTLENFASAEPPEAKGSSEKTVDGLVDARDVVTSQTIFSSGEMETSDHPARSFRVRGNTYPHKDTLRELGGRWDSISKEWVFTDSTQISKLKEYADLQIVIPK